jgi:hypothetical protein
LFSSSFFNVMFQIQNACFLLLITFIIFGVSSAFFGGFVEVSGVLKHCTNITDGVSLTFRGDLCLSPCHCIHSVLFNIYFGNVLLLL